MFKALPVVLLAAALTCAGCGVRAAKNGVDGTDEATGTVAGGALSSERDANELVVAISGMVTPDEGLKYYEGLSRYVANKAGMRLRLVHKTEYAELNRLLAEGKVDMAYSCSGPYVTGHDEFGLELLAAPVVNGESTYRAYIIVPKSSEATSLASLEGDTFAFTDPNSNTGCLVPTYMLAIMDRSPEEFFERVVYTYSHDNSIKAVASGEADGASVDSLIYDYAADTDATYTSKTRIIAESDAYGIPPVVVRPGLDEGLKRRLQEAFLGAEEDPEGRELLDKMNIEEFVEIDDSAYDSVREISAWLEERSAE